MTALCVQTLNLCKSSALHFSEAAYAQLPPSNAAGRGKKFEVSGGVARSSFVAPIRAMEASEATKHANGKSNQSLHNSTGDVFTDDCGGFSGKNAVHMSTVGNSSNIVWHKCSVEKSDRQELLNQKGCVIWITGLSGSVISRAMNLEISKTGKGEGYTLLIPRSFTPGKSTVACALSRALHARGKLTYILDGDNCRHGLNRDLSFKAEDRSENIRRIGEVAKLFADAGLICIASLISPFRKERDACRNLLPEGDFIEVYMDVPLQVCETRDPKGLYKLARAGKIKGFTGVDDPYEPPLNSEIVLRQRDENCDTPSVMAEKVVSFLERKGYLVA